MHLNSFVPAFISCRGVLSRTLLCAQRCAQRRSAPRDWQSRIPRHIGGSHREFWVCRFGALHPERADYREDTRLVVDFFDRSGKETSYRANPGFLANLRNTMRRPIDARFQKYFETFTPLGLTNRCSQPLADVRKAEDEL